MPADQSEKAKMPTHREAAERFFEPQFIALGLSNEQIVNQGLAELGQSLETINAAMQRPESFGVVKVNIGAGGSVFLAQTEAQIEVGILPLLLERKRFILERISLLEKKEEIVDLSERAKGALDESEKKKYEERIDELQTIVSSLEESRVKNEEQLRNAEKALQEAHSEVKRQEIEERRERLKLESWERRTKVWQRFLERESVVTIVGSLLLVLIAFFLIIATIWSIEALGILGNAFLVILGYFFGQSVGRLSAREKDSSPNEPLN